MGDTDTDTDTGWFAVAFCGHEIRMRLCRLLFFVPGIYVMRSPWCHGHESRVTSHELIVMVSVCDEWCSVSTL